MGKDALCLACMFSYGVSNSSGFCRYSVYLRQETRHRYICRGRLGFSDGRTNVAVLANDSFFS